MKTYDVDLNKVVEKTLIFLKRHDVPKHWSKTRNELYDVHLMIGLYVLYCMADKSYRRFRRLLQSCPPTSLNLDTVPSFTTMWRAWRRIPPRLLRELIQLSGRGGRDRVAALDPTHFQITKPSMSYCKRTKRNPLREPNRKVSVVTGTRSLRIIDAVIHKDSHRHGLDDLAEIAGPWMQNKTVVADTEFDAEERFHEIVISFGGKGVAPLRHKVIPIWRTRGARRKELRRKWLGRSYRRRPLAETLNSMLKRGMSARLRGRTVWQQARHFYAKCLAHNLMMRSQK